MSEDAFDYLNYLIYLLICINVLHITIISEIVYKFEWKEEKSAAAAAAAAAADPAGAKRVQFETADRVKFENSHRDQS